VQTSPHLAARPTFVYDQTVSELSPPGSIALLARAIEAMADGVVVADTRRGEVHVNAAARAMLGLPADGPVTTSFLKDRLGFYPFDLVAAGGTAVREEVRIGEALYHSVVSPILDEGAPVGAIVVLRDLGETRAALRQRAEFASQVSHELRTPLTSVAGALDIVLSGYAGSLTDKQQRYVEMARQAASRMNALIDQLLEAARAGTGRISLVRSRMDVAQLVRDVVERYRDVARAKPAQLTARITTSSVGIEGDHERLAQVLGNLLSNSVKFAPPGGHVDVEVFAPAGVASVVGVSVYNDGEPIPEEERERIFDPFETSGRRVGGSGLGLGISRAIVEAHGGRIWVEAGAAGTKFVFTLPTAPSMLATGTTPPPMDPPRRAPTAEIARVLVADADRHGAYLLKGLLMAAGHHVDVAHDADSALALARELRPNLVVVSGAMPDATALIAIIEHDPDTRNAVVLGVGTFDEAHDLAAAGAVDVVQRPVQPTELIGAAGRVLADASRRHRQRVLVVDDDPSIRAICREVLEQSGFLVRDAGSADAALAEARRFRPDLILLDVMMPVVDGFRTAEHLRADAATAMTPLIFLSAKGETADKVRAFRSGAEDYIVKPFDSAELVARVAKALERQARELGASPTTQLPGADAIEGETDRRLREHDRNAVCCYLDLDNLKAFNDYYGYAKADGVIRQTGDLIRDVVARLGSPGDFIGHIAGDDFVLVCSQESADRVCTAICDRFDQLIPLYYNRDDRARGYIEAKDRWGTLRRFPIMTVSIAAVTIGDVGTFAEVAVRASDGKKLAKSLPGSTYVRDGHVVIGGDGATPANDAAAHDSDEVPAAAGETPR
jgi:signal transduction histidine kinase/DNA-binding response OmpR family regulator